MCNRFISLLPGNTILTDVQHGFWKESSTKTAILSFFESIQESIGKEENQIRIFCDLTKACDAISHDILLTKFISYGVRGIVNSWFESYLAHWKQTVEINTNCNKSTILGKHISE
jgi:hypothetical protein